MNAKLFKIICDKHNLNDVDIPYIYHYFKLIHYFVPYSHLSYYNVPIGNLYQYCTSFKLHLASFTP